MPEYVIDWHPQDGPIGFVIEVSGETRGEARRKFIEAFDSDEPHIITGLDADGNRHELRVHIYPDNIENKHLWRE